MDWSILTGPLAQFAVPVIKQAVSMGVGQIPIAGSILGPIAAEAVGSLLAAAFGTEATPEAVKKAIETTPPQEAAAKLAAVDAEAASKWPALAQMAESAAKVDIANIESNADIMKAQIASSEMLPEGAWKTFIVIANAIWRPLFAIEWLAECSFFFFGIHTLIFKALEDNQYKDIDALVKLLPLVVTLLLPYMVARFGLLGYHMRLRTDEKQMAANVATGQPPAGSGLDPNVLANIIKAVAGKR